MQNSSDSALIPPKILVQVPKKFLKALDLSRILEEALNLINYENPFSVVIALSTLESYLDAAKRQQRRIARARASMKKNRLSQSNLFQDVHFYLISWARIAKLARYIRDQTRFKRTGLVVRRYNSELNNRIDGRDHLEHFEERLPGGPKQGKLKVPGDLLNMRSNYHLGYGGRTIDVGPLSVDLLQNFVAEFRTALLFDSIEVIGLAKPNRLIEIFQQTATRVWIDKLRKRFEKR